MAFTSTLGQEKSRLGGMTLAIVSPPVSSFLTEERAAASE